MTPTVDDLKVLFEDAAARPPLVGDLAGTAARRGRAVRRRQVGIAAAAAAVAVVAVAVPGLTRGPNGAPPVNTPSPVATPGEQDPPLPEYLRGGHLLASAQVADPQGTALTFSPTTLAFGLVASCAGAAPGLSLAYGTTATPLAVVRLNGHRLDGLTCLPDALGTDGDADFGQVATDWAGDFGVVVGQPSQLTVGYPDGATQPGTRWRLAVYESVPFDAFPFPDPPSPLPQLSESLLAHVDGGRLLLDSGPHPADPQGFSYTVPVQHGLAVATETAAPGALRMYVGDRLVWSGRSWDYQLATARADLTLDELGIQPGDDVTLRFEADRYPPRTYRVMVYDLPVPAR